jgi:hypothetical protein
MALGGLNRGVLCIAGFYRALTSPRSRVDRSRCFGVCCPKVLYGPWWLPRFFYKEKNF